MSDFFWQVTIAVAHTTAAGHIVVPTSAVERASLAAWVGVHRPPFQVSISYKAGGGSNKLWGGETCFQIEAVFLGGCVDIMVFHHWCPGAWNFKSCISTFLAAKTHDVSGRHLQTTIKSGKWWFIPLRKSINPSERRWIKNPLKKKLHGVVVDVGAKNAFPKRNYTLQEFNL